MERRNNPLLRARIDLLLLAVKAGRLSIGDAGRRMDQLGVPFAVACRVLTRSPVQAAPH
ncbi:hypothetical protein [Azoarcus olearius]|uniref:Uncharacterized protein n=1 Tax=Azoarcus sp. (strain BH72) TaxID=418699 RepID=A1K4Q3_AZOSB|nr:hypothetical protein [Azoarcus olearius]ANQ84359.1 hypothetical protein dqs_1306 [Azoarcus olearius]CAL93808.1 Hypothetical protein azo1191 [Azoarcus olearius]